MKQLRCAIILLWSFAMMFISAGVLSTAAEESIEMTPMYGEQFQPEGVTFGRVSFLIPNTNGLTKDGWDNSIEHNEDLVLISYVKDGISY